MAAPPAPNPLAGRPAENPATRWAPGTPQPTGRIPGTINPLAAKPPAPVAPVATLPPQAFPRTPAGMEDRVSTRIPTSKKLIVDPHERNDISAGYHAMLALDRHHYAPEHHEEARGAIEEALGKHAKLIREEYPHIDTEGLSDRAVHERFIEHAHRNIHWLFNKVKDEPWAPLAAQWYTGANRIAKQMADLHGVSHRQAAGVIAALSPRKDWDQNVDIAKRVMGVHANHQETPISQAMRDKIDEYLTRREEGSGADALALMANGGENKKTGGTVQPMAVGVALKDLQHPLQKALFARAYDEAHGPGKAYDIISPAGERTRAMTKAGKEATTTWSGFDRVAQAMRILERDHLPTISEALGEKHKVRNFYNNIIAPDAAAYLRPKHHDATVDTHQINVANMLPMGGSHRLVSQGLGTGGGSSHPAHTGSAGLYPLHLEALRRAAATISKQEGRQYLPREVQSVVWEAIRSMFPEHTKGYDKGMPTHAVGIAARDAGYAAKHGFMPREMANEAVLRAASGGGTRAGRLPFPNWARGLR